MRLPSRPLPKDRVEPTTDGNLMPTLIRSYYRERMRVALQRWLRKWEYVEVTCTNCGKEITDTVEPVRTDLYQVIDELLGIRDEAESNVACQKTRWSA